MKTRRFSNQFANRIAIVALIFIFTFSDGQASDSCELTIVAQAIQQNSSVSLESVELDLSIVSEIQTLSPLTEVPETQFGNSVSLRGNTLAVGARTGSDEFRGAVEVFEYQNGQWQRVKSLKSPNLQPREDFNRVVLDGDTLLVGARNYCLDGVDFYCGNGLVYVFGRDEGGQNSWGFVKQLDGGFKADAGFGHAVSIDSNTAVVSARSEPIGSYDQAGAVYIFDRDHGGKDQWGLTKRLEGDIEHMQNGRFFGDQISIQKDTLLVLGVEGTAIYEYGRNSCEVDNWGFVQKFTVPVGTVGTGGLAFDGQTLFLRVSDQDIPGDERNTHLLFYRKDSLGGWKQHQEIVIDLGLRYQAIDGNQALIASLDPATGYLLERDPYQDSWKFTTKFVPSDESILTTGSKRAALDSGRAIFGWTGAKDDQGLAFYYETAPSINAGHSGAWFNTVTPGQGQLVDIEPEKQFIFLSWFTYTDSGSANPFEQRWLTAQGNYAGNKAELPIYETLGGRFDDPQAVSSEQIGELTLSFSDCGLGQMTYHLGDEELSGSFPMKRAVPGSESRCEEQTTTATQSVDINAGVNGAWFNENTPGQGFLIDAHPDPLGGNFIFVAWFTYGDDTTSGQRWLTAQGSFEGSIADVDVYETTGGSFDDPQNTETILAGTMHIDFSDCSNAQLSYSLADDDLGGFMNISRVIPGTNALCEELDVTN